MITEEQDGTKTMYLPSPFDKLLRRYEVFFVNMGFPSLMVEANVLEEGSEMLAFNDAYGKLLYLINKETIHYIKSHGLVGGEQDTEPTHIQTYLYDKPAGIGG